MDRNLRQERKLSETLGKPQGGQSSTSWLQSAAESSEFRIAFMPKSKIQYMVYAEDSIGALGSWVCLAFCDVIHSREKAMKRSWIQYTVASEGKGCKWFWNGRR